MAPIRPNGSKTPERRTSGTMRHVVESSDSAIKFHPKRTRNYNRRRIFPENGRRRDASGRISKRRRGRPGRKVWDNCSAIKSRSPSPCSSSSNRPHTPTTGERNPRNSPIERVWYRIPPPERSVPDLVIARFYDKDLEVNTTSVLDISRPFDYLLELLRLQSDMVKVYFTCNNGGFTLDDGPWWYEILVRPEAGEDISLEEHWELLGDSDDYVLMKQRVMLNPRTWSVVFRHHKQMPEYGLAERTQAIMRQRVIGGSLEEQAAVEDMIAESNHRQLLRETDSDDPMDLSET